MAIFRHDDYDYGEVNQLLERPLKAFIKTVCCYPERITKQDYDNVMREFKHSEKVNILISNNNFDGWKIFERNTEILLFLLVFLAGSRKSDDYGG